MTSIDGPLVLLWQHRCAIDAAEHREIAASLGHRCCDMPWLAGRVC
jgi:hypothetical protein